MMAVVTWNRGPWASRDRAMPYQGITAPASQAPSRGYELAPGVPMAYASLLNPVTEGGDNSGVSSRGEPAAFGDAPSISGALGGGLSGRVGGALASRAADLGLSLATGLGPSPIGGPVAAYGLMSAINNAIRGWSGAPALEANPWGGVPTMAEIAQARDLEPNKVAGMEAQRAAREAAMRQFGMEDVSERFGGLSQSGSYGGDYGGTTGADGSRGGGSMGGGGGETSGTGGVGGMGGADTSGDTGHGGPGGATYAKGGVLRARGPRRVTVGDNPMRDEMMIAVPREMMKPGMQGNEPQVRRGLRSAYRSLMPQGKMSMGRM